MQVSEARAGRSVVVSNFKSMNARISMSNNVDRNAVRRRGDRTSGVMIAPVPNSDGEIWYVRHNLTSGMAVYSIDELDILERSTSTLRTWSRTPEQIQALADANSEQERLAQAEARREMQRRERERRQLQRQQEEETLEEERQAEEARLAMQAERAANVARIAQERLDALRAGRRRDTPAQSPPPPPPSPRLPQEDGERFLDI
jgi:flagellar biosynthesis GTPase FlhF